MKERAHWRFARIFVLLAVVVALLAMLGMAGFAAEADTAERECYLSGDLNGDGDLTPKDAIYALYSGFFGQESYPISQDWDYDANGKHNSRDAIELLYACYGMSDKVSTDMVHDYHDPVWSWNDAGDTISVSVTFKCGCQDAFIVPGTTEGEQIPAETTAPATTVPPTTQAPATQPGEEPGNGGAFWWILVILAAAAAAVAAWLLLGKRKKA